MLKYTLGLILAVIIGAFVFGLVLMTLFAESVGVGIFFLVFAFVLLFAEYKIIRFLIKYNKKVNTPSILNIPAEDILFECKISGREWESFKQDECSSKPILIKSFLVSAPIALISYYILNIRLGQEVDDLSSLISIVISSLTFVLVFYLIFYINGKIYRRLNLFDMGNLKVSVNYLEFNGELIPINSLGYKALSATIKFKDFYNYMEVTRSFYNPKKFIVRRLVFPIPDNQMADIQEILPKLIIK